MNLANFNTNSVPNIIGSVLSLILAPALFFIPIVLAWFLKTNKHELPKYDTIVKYESSYNEQRVHHFAPLFYNVFFVAKRLIFAFILVTFRDVQAVQF